MPKKDETREELEGFVINKYGEFDPRLLTCVRYSKKWVSLRENAGLHEIVFPVDVRDRGLTHLDVIHITQAELKDIFNRVLKIRNDNDILSLATDYGALHLNSFNGVNADNPPFHIAAKQGLKMTMDTLEDWYRFSADARCVMQLHTLIREGKPGDSFTQKNGMVRFNFTDGEETDFIKTYYKKYSIPQSCFLEYHRSNFYELGMLAITKILNENLSRAYYKTAVYLYLDEDRQRGKGLQRIEYQRSLDLFSLVWRAIADTVNAVDPKDRNAWYKCRSSRCGLYDKGMNMRISKDGKTAIHPNCYNADKQAENNYYK